MFRAIKESDKDIFIELATEFYNSEAVLHPIPKENMINAFNALMQTTPYMDGYIFEYDDRIVGYALVCKSYSMEAGGLTYLIDEIYIREEFRNKKLGREFFDYILNSDNIKRFRLEVEHSNKRAIKLYKNVGFNLLTYMQMYKE